MSSDLRAVHDFARTAEMLHVRKTVIAAETANHLALLRGEM
jgi:hypothetical protein